MGSGASKGNQPIKVQPVEHPILNHKAPEVQISIKTTEPLKKNDLTENKVNSLVDKAEKTLEVNNKTDVNSTGDLDKKVEESILTTPNMSADSKAVDNSPGHDQDQAPSKKAEKPTEMSSKKSTADQNEEQENKSDAEETEEVSETKKVPLTAEQIEEKKTQTFKALKKDLDILSDIDGHLNEKGTFDKDFKNATFNLQSHHFALKKASLDIDNQFKVELGDVFVELGGVKIVCDVVVYCQKKGYYNEENKLIQGVSMPLINCLIILLNFTDANARHCHLLVEHAEFLPQILEALQRLLLSHLEDSMRVKDEKALGYYHSIIHNIAQSELCIHELREMGIVEVLLPYLKSSKDKILLTTLASLADIVDDSEAAHLETGGDLFKFLLKTLKSAMNDRHRRCKGWSARELARTVRRIAKNDVNKKSLVAQGSLPVLVSLTESKYEDEQIEAFGALWMLSFDKENQDIMLQNEAVMEALVNSRKSQNKKIEKSCSGALWNMREKLSAIEKYKELGKEFSRSETDVTRSNSAGSSRGHVMLSYQWANQNTIKKIRDNLQANGIKCWMDIDDMQGSTLNAMARAVEGAEIVLICYSKKYQDSPNCRAEAEYAFQLRKPIIPLKMERNYQAREWLGFIIGSKLFFEFTDKYPFDSKMSALIKEVLSRQKKSIPENPVISSTLPAPTQKVETSSSKPNTKIQASEVVKNWKETDVLRWINHHKLPSSKFSSLTGIEIAFLQVLRQESPDFFYKTLNDMLKIKDLPTLAKFTFALEDTLV